MEGSVSSFCKFSYLCVFGGAMFGKDACFREAAHSLGKIIAEKQIHLVYGGGSVGLMGCVATSAYVGGSKVLGVIPQPLATNKIIGLTVGDELRVSNIQDRMINMINNAEAFIALPGGFGTLEEIFHVVTWSQLNIHQKPVGLLNVNGFFDGLLSFMDYSVEKGFISAIARKLIIVAETPQDLINKLQDFVHKTDPYLTQVVWTGIDNRRKCKLDLSLTL